MSWVEWWWRIMLTASIAGREYWATNPLRISLTASWPRSVLQCLFFTMLGRVIGGEQGQSYVFIGSIAIVIALSTVGFIGDVPIQDRYSATFHRLRSGRLPVFVIYAVRAWPVVAEAALIAAVSLLVVGLITGQGSLLLRLAVLYPIYLLMILTSAAAGLAAASIGLAGRTGADVIVGNVGLYLIIAASGAIVPPGRVAWLDAIGTVLPMRNALSAIRHHLAGQPWVGDLLREMAIGLSWTVVAAVAYTALAWRVRRTDHDKVT